MTAEDALRLILVAQSIDLLLHLRDLALEVVDLVRGARGFHEPGTARALHLPRQPYPHADECNEGKPRDQERHIPLHFVLLRADGDRHALAIEPLHPTLVIRRVALEAAAV